MTSIDTETATARDPDQGTDSAPTTLRVLYAGEGPASGPTPAEIESGRDDVEVTHETDFVVALDRVDDGRVDCVVATHRESGFDGLGFLEAVRREYSELPVVLVPEAADGDVARRAVEADATALVPANAADALDAVVSAVEANTDPAASGNGARMPITDLTVEAERRLKERALDEAPIGITISDAEDPENPIIYVNDSFEEMTGYPPDEVVGVNHRFLQGPETDPDRVAALGEGIAAKRDTRVVLRNYRKDGQLFWNQVDVSPILDEDGEVSHYVGFQMDVTERERTKRELRAERETLDRLLDRVNGLVNDVTEALVRAGSREEIEALTTDRIGGGGEYADAWIGRYDETGDEVIVTQRAADDDPVDLTLDLEREEPGVRALREVVEDQATRVVEDVDALPASQTSGQCVLVPLTYRSTTYGVLAVFDEEGFLDDRERVLLGSLGRSIGTSINDVLTKRTMATDTVLNVAVDVHDDVPLVDLASDLACEFDHEATIPDGDSNDLITLVSTDHGDGAAIVEAAEAADDVVSAEVLVADDDGCVVQLRLAGSPLVEILSEHGGRLTGMNADGTSLSVEFRVGTERAARRALDDMRDTYDRVELAAYHDATEPAQTARGFREELRSRLTDRQFTALQKAYVSGFFEWPRRAEGEQLAASMDIVPSTYHQHLQAAKRKLVGAFFEE